MSNLSAGIVAEAIEAEFKRYADRFTPEELAGIGDRILLAFLEIDYDADGDDGILGAAERRHRWKRYRFPKNPSIGTTAKDPWGGTHTFTGTTWEENE